MLTPYELLVSLHGCLTSSYQSFVRLAQSPIKSVLTVTGPSFSRLLLSFMPWVVDTTSDHKWAEQCCNQSFGMTGCSLPPCDVSRHSAMILVMVGAQEILAHHFFSSIQWVLLLTQQNVLLSKASFVAIITSGITTYLIAKIFFNHIYQEPNFDSMRVHPVFYYL